jgi:hypothetical protein
MLICFVIRLGIVKGEETNHILESKFNLIPNSLLTLQLDLNFHSV